MIAAGMAGSGGDGPLRGRGEGVLGQDRLAALRQAVARIEGAAPDAGMVQGSGVFGGRVLLGHGPADAATGGLARGAVHEVIPAGAPDLAAATDFALALAGRLVRGGDAAKGPEMLRGRHKQGGGLWLWVRQEMARREAGEPYAPGLPVFGLDPACLVSVIAADTAEVLRAAEEGLQARAFRAVLIEPFGDTRVLDLTATRRLSLIAADCGTAGLLLRTGGSAASASVATRWEIRAGPSVAAGPWPGWPVFEAALTRNRQGPCGGWRMEWNIDEYRFQPPAAAALAATRQPAGALSGGGLSVSAN